MKPRYDVALLSVVSPWLSVYCSYLRKLLYCPAWLQLDLRCMLWWEVREIISENILLIISYHQPWRLFSPPPASSKSSSASRCSPVWFCTGSGTGAVRWACFIIQYNTMIHILPQVWFGTTDFEMGYKETSNEVDAEVLGCGILTCMCIVSLTILLRWGRLHSLLLLSSFIVLFQVTS